jgi:hypothetical protein
MVAGRAGQRHFGPELRRDLVCERAEHLRGHTRRGPRLRSSQGRVSRDAQFLDSKGKEPSDGDRGPRRNRNDRATARAMKFFCRVAMNSFGAPVSELAFDEECKERSAQSTMASSWRFACA